MKKLVLSGSVKMASEIEEWRGYWQSQSAIQILDYPLAISSEGFLQEYSQVFQKYFSHLDETDMLFVVNGEKNGVKGYIGAGMFSEIAYVVSRIARGEKQEVILANSPASQLFCSDEIDLWIRLGWVRIFVAK